MAINMKSDYGNGYDKRTSFNNTNQNGKYEKYNSYVNNDMNGKSQFYQYRNNNDKSRNYQQSYVHSVPQNQTSYMQPAVSYYVSNSAFKKENLGCEADKFLLTVFSRAFLVLDV